MIAHVYNGLGYAMLSPNVRGSVGYDDKLMRGNLNDIGGGDYYRHLTALVRVVEFGGEGAGGSLARPRVARAGATTVRHVTESPDHFAHAENYCWAASQMERTPALGLVIGRGAKGW